MPMPCPPIVTMSRPREVIVGYKPCGAPIKEKVHDKLPEWKPQPTKTGTGILPFVLGCIFGSMIE